MVLGVLACVASGAAMVFPAPGFDAEQTLNAVSDHGCTALHGVPSMFIALLEHPRLREVDVSRLRTGIMAGAPCPVEVMKRVVNEMHCREITIACGMTETSPVCNMTEVDDPLEVRVGTVGKVMGVFGSTIALINPRLGRFNVTSKGGIIHRSYFDLRIAFPLVCLLALNVAGLFMARHRYLTDPAHHDTVIMNVVWTIYNIVILSVATSVALERRQRRSEVRVDLQAPLTVLTPDGRHVTGMTSQLSRGGATAHFDGALGLSAGSQVVLTLRDRRARCNITARIVGSNGQTAHLAFLPLELQQEKFLLSLAFSRSDAWLAWHSSRRERCPCCASSSAVQPHCTASPLGIRSCNRGQARRGCKSGRQCRC
jgi:acyl-CoA synthetase (AMP-forming)/AMP-acid ligase II